MSRPDRQRTGPRGPAAPREGPHPESDDGPDAGPDDAGWSALVTCEHGGHEVPVPWRALFAGREALLRSHRGWDPGALAAARVMARALRAPMVGARVTRLLVDLNRSAHRRWSAITRGLPADAREQLLQAHWRPYRERIERRVAAEIEAGRRVLHVSMHSFTPELDGVRREADIGLLYDPSRPWERRACDEWARALARLAPGRRVRRNYPYLGTADGLTTSLRRRFDADRYVGIELELNQALAVGPQARALRREAAVSLRAAIAALRAWKG